MGILVDNAAETLFPVIEFDYDGNDGVCVCMHTFCRAALKPSRTPTCFEALFGYYKDLPDTVYICKKRVPFPQSVHSKYKRRYNG